VVAQLPTNVAGALDGVVQGQGGRTPFLRYGNVPALVLCVLMFALAVGITRTARRRAQ
jgi:apolipoprotein N-acyltransferase